MRQLGRPGDPWQELFVLDAHGVRDDGLWAMFELLLLLARQNGKGWCTDAIELGGLFLFREPLILHSSHQFKALDVDTPILTSRGWSTMGALADGDEVYGPDGQLTKVVAAHPRRVGRPCYRLRLDDGQEIVADADHLWEVVEPGGRRRVLTTQQIADSGISTVQPFSSRDRRRYHFRLDLPAPLAGVDAALPIDPWLLGAWLGDGTTTKGEITVGAEDRDYLLARLTALGETYRVRPDVRWPDRVFTVIVRGLIGRLRAAGVLGAKHIPDGYMLASQRQRRELLAGIMDTDGTVSTSQITVTMSNARLMDDVASLVRSLGYKASLREYRASLNGVDAGPMYRVQFSSSTDVNPFAMPRKAAKVKPRHHRKTRAHYNAIVAVDPVQTRPTRCITVAHESSLYLAGRGLIPTHNTSTSTFRRLIDIIDSSDWLTKRVKNVSRSKGDEGIYLTRAAGGGALQFVARSLGSGRGLTGSKNIFDEAWALTIGQYAAQTPTLSTIPNPQIIYTTTPPDDDLGPVPSDAMLPSVRRRAVAGSERIGVHEYSPAAGFDRTDRDVWYENNPSAGIRIAEWFLAKQLAAFTAAGKPQKFDTEHLGVWPLDEAAQWLTISRSDWEAAADIPPAPTGRMAFGLEVEWDRSHGAIGVAWRRPDNRRQVELTQDDTGVDHRPGTAWMLGRGRELLKRWPGSVLVIPDGPAGSLHKEFEDAGVPFVPMKAIDQAKAFGDFYDSVAGPEVDKRDLRHGNQKALNDGVAGGVARPVGDAKAWDRKASINHCPLGAGTAALFGLRNLTIPRSRVY